MKAQASKTLALSMRSDFGTRVTTHKIRAIVTTGFGG
jgi:hypothetical protein